MKVMKSLTMAATLVMAVVACNDDSIVAVSGISVEPASLSLAVGEHWTLVATVSPENADNKSVTWSSDHTGVATVDASGAVTAVSAGVAKITVTTSDGGKTAVCELTVSDDGDGDGEEESEDY